MKRLVLVASLMVHAGPLAAQHTGHGGHPASPYAGQEERTIKSLSPDDLAELRRGGGWGLAKPAELNGVPGPAHLLELKEQIALTEEQASAIETLFVDMRAQAIAEGEHLIALELALETAFRDRSITENELRRLLGEIEDSRSRLRYIHLSTHLRTPAILTEAQIARYNTLRGYGVDQ